MPKSGYSSQQCKCGSPRGAVASVTLSGSTLGIVPRHKSIAATIYICRKCAKKPSRKTRMQIVTTIVRAVRDALNIPKINPTKKSAAAGLVVRRRSTRDLWRSAARKIAGKSKKK